VGASILVKLEYRALVFVEGKKLENPWKTPGSKARTNDNSTHMWHLATLVEGEHSRHCTIPSPLLHIYWSLNIDLTLVCAQCAKQLLNRPEGKIVF